MNLETQYLGFSLPHPLIVGAGPLSDTVDGIRQAEDAGASAVVLRSLFEEQISAESMAAHRSFEYHADSFGEAQSFLPSPEEYMLGPEEYLEHIRSARQAVRIPVIASLNGSTLGRWLEYAKLMEQAGASALEINVFQIPTSPDESASAIEERTAQVVSEIRRTTQIPLAVKLSPFYTAPAHFAARLEAAGANGLILFNRFFEPDISLEELEYTSNLHLSTPSELLLRLRWIAILSGHIEGSLAVTGGVHSGIDAVKAIMCGAHAVQLVSSVLKHGVCYIAHMLQEVKLWMAEHEYESIQQMCGSMNLYRCPDPASLLRGNYIHMLQTWQP